MRSAQQAPAQSQRGGFGSTGRVEHGSSGVELTMRREAVDAASGLAAASSSSSASTTTCMDGKAYWTEQACYAFTSDEIDQLEAATEELHGLCLKAVEHVVANKLWERMRIPPAWGDYIERVWRRADPTIWSAASTSPTTAEGPPKLLEYNADTPTALYEARGRAVVLAEGREARRRPVQLDPREADRGVARRPAAALPPEALRPLRALRGPARGSRDLGVPARHRAAGGPRRQAASRSPQIGWNGRRFTDPDEMPIQVMSKLYPWEWMVREAFGAHVLDRHHGVHRAGVEDDPQQQDAAAALVGGLSRPRQPAAGLRHRACRPRRRLREEADLRPRGPQRHHRRPGLVRHRGRRATAAKAIVWQAYQPLPVFDGNHAVVGSWVIEGKPAGIGMREDERRITHNNSRFVPHYFEPGGGP